MKLLDSFASRKTSTGSTFPKGIIDVQGSGKIDQLNTLCLLILGLTPFCYHKIFPRKQDS